MTAGEPTPLPDYDAGVLAAALGLDPEQVTHLSIVVEARCITVRWSGYKRISSDQLERAVVDAIKATKQPKAPAKRPASTRGRRKA